MRVTDLKSFLIKAKSIHGDNFNYSEVIYKDSRTKIKIKCNRCQSIINITPKSHYLYDCKKCSALSLQKERLKKIKASSLVKYNKLLPKLKVKYPNILWDKVIFENMTSLIEFECKYHGKFTKSLSVLMNQKYGCSKCGDMGTISNQSLTTEEYIAKAKALHGDDYDYSKIVYTRWDKPVTVICNRCNNEFSIIANNFTSKRLCGCFKCNIFEALAITNEDFIQRVKERNPFSKTFDFSNTLYKGANSPIDCYCTIHKEPFTLKQADSLYTSRGCDKCRKSKSYSIVEKELADWLSSYTDVIENYKPSWLKGKELDIYLPKFNLAIEYNGLYWHSEKRLGKSYHKDKTDLCNANNVNLFHIWEDEMIFQKPIIHSMLLNKLNLTPFKIGARKCNIKEIANKQANSFLKENHLLGGNSNYTTALGLYFEDELLCVMGFIKKENQIELTKFATKIYTLVQGGFSKLLKFLGTSLPIISYVDLRWSTGSVYKTNKFIKVRSNRPSYFYFKNGIRHHRRGFQKKMIKKKFNLDIDIKDFKEVEQMEKLGYERIFNCGTDTYVKGEE